ncbi:MAG TPA: hypothetical protein VM802_05960 [Chitinophaga sp.]|uniref:tetratricopeptide repeat protein n=1 Tax=Chitinophaga sp. TaxID=1869181 RepID=UPI002CBAC235|nr:hypothetical protein [Chitinophaga sp.]HVI44390.1 hypothetical protein [Chitinophaga sp.]
MKSRKQLFADLRKKPEDPDLLSEIASSYYKEANYKKAYVYDRRAWLCNRNNTIHITNLAADLEMLGWLEDAIKLSKWVLTWSIERICRHTNVSTSRAMTIKNDCRFRVSYCYYKLEQHSLARRYLNLYFKIKKRDKLPSDLTHDHQKEFWRSLNLDGKMKIWETE